MAVKKYRKYWKKLQPKKDEGPKLKAEYKRCETCGVPMHEEGRDQVMWCTYGNNCGMEFNPPTSIEEFSKATGIPLEQLG